MLTLNCMNIHITNLHVDTRKDLRSCHNLVNEEKVLPNLWKVQVLPLQMGMLWSAGACARAPMSWELFASTIFSRRFTNLDSCEPAAKDTSLTLRLSTTGLSATLCVRASWEKKKKKASVFSFTWKKTFFLQFSVFRMTEIVQHTETHTHPAVLGTHPARKISSRIIKVWQSYK